ncbi:MAG: hypothetical protein R3304_11145 [Longimicrobiales bacterium]|nr:hypothetical protein [Longimicrobiales bacterium]
MSIRCLRPHWHAGCNEPERPWVRLRADGQLFQAEGTDDELVGVFRWRVDGVIVLHGTWRGARP